MTPRKPTNLDVTKLEDELNGRVRQPKRMHRHQSGTPRPRVDPNLEKVNNPLFWAVNIEAKIIGVQTQVKQRFGGSALDALLEKIGEEVSDYIHTYREDIDTELDTTS